uniref:Putative alkaline nuclease n=1 Tax=Xenopsylla cheopis TaxID=163159 RepID=A0A6M2DWU0_XENCH
MLKRLVLLIFSLHCVVSRVINYKPDDKASSGCSVPITGGLGNPQPLFVVPGTDKFLEPKDSSGNLRLEYNQEVELVCAGNQFNTLSMPWFWWLSRDTYSDIITATCIEGSTFELPWGKANISTARCVSNPFHEAQRTGRKCGRDDGRSEIYEIGFELSTGRVLKLFDLCHDSDMAETLYSHHKMTAANAGYQHSVPRPNFIQDHFDFPVDNAYKRKSQKEMIAQILNSTKLANELVHDTNDYFMARGHLAAKVDFIYGSQQRGTFYFLNTAPQWQTFNGGNWEHIESSVRDFVGARGIEVDLYTGTDGVLTFPNEKGVQKEIYLNFDENANPRLPVPKIYYKIIYQPKTKLGVVLIGVNNPYASLDEIRKDYIYCSDIISKLDWLDFDSKDLKRGYTYACDLNEFFKAVPNAPQLDVEGLLY